MPISLSRSVYNAPPFTGIKLVRMVLFDRLGLMSMSWVFFNPFLSSMRLEIEEWWNDDCWGFETCEKFIWLIAGFGPLSCAYLPFWALFFCWFKWNISLFVDVVWSKIIMFRSPISLLLVRFYFNYWGRGFLLSPWVTALILELVPVGFLVAISGISDYL